MKRYLIASGILVACAILFGGILPDARAETAEREYCRSVGGTPNGLGRCDFGGSRSCNETTLYQGGCIYAPGSPSAGVTLYNYRDDNGNPLKEGDLISAARYGDPDIFIVKLSPHDPFAGYKRLFLNPAIFNMYGHLGGFANVRPVSPAVRDLFETSGLFRNCETDDQKVWAVEVTGEDDAILHHVQISGDVASREDPYFFLRVFCINSREDRFYARSIYPYTRLADVPRYHRRVCRERPACLDSEPRCLMPEPAEGWCPRPTPACGREGSDVPSTSGNACCPGLTAVQRKDANGNSYGSSAWKCGRPGCYYQDVQCVRAPCEPALVCPSPTPTPPPNITSVDMHVSQQPDGQTLYFVVVSGRLPNRCYDVNTTYSRNGTHYDIGVTFASNLGPDQGACVPGEQSYSTTVTLSDAPSLPGGTYSVYVNSRYWTAFTKASSSGSCYVGGCSGQLCTDRPDAVSTCEYRAEYACYQYSRCERQSSGSCGWSATDQFSQCWANAGSGY